MQYHEWSDGHKAFPIGKAVCIGRNYVAHAKELGNAVPTEPLLFLKPSTAMVPMDRPIVIPADQGRVHHEVEIAVLIQSQLTDATPETAAEAIGGIGVALDLTLRDIQSELKEKGHPWERAKAFDGSCPVSRFYPGARFADLQDIDLELKVNNEVRQTGNSSAMIFPVIDLIAQVSTHFTLIPGDIVLTGTPAGVSELESRNQIVIKLGEDIELHAEVA